MQTILVTGAAKRIGRGIALRLAREGYRVAIHYHASEAAARATAEECGGAPLFRANLENVEEIRGMFQDIDSRLGGLYGLVNNAARFTRLDPLEITERDWDFIHNVNLKAQFFCAQQAARMMLGAGEGRIVNISSIGGLVPIPHLAAYCTGKFALTGYSRSLRNELMKDGIYVCTICPSLMRTGSVDHAKFKGQARKEYTIFSLTASLPLISQSAERSARKIIKAAHFGQAELVISLNAKLAQLLDSHFPGLFSDIMSLANYLLPGPTDNLDMSLEGKDAHTFISDSILTQSSHSAALRNNEGQIRHT